MVAPITNQTINVGQRFFVTVRPTAQGIPVEMPQFVLTEKPSGAAVRTIRGTNGVISWSPTREFADTTNRFTLVVTARDMPSLSATQSFQIVVTDFAQTALGTTVIQEGQDGCVPLSVDSNESITNVEITLTWPLGTFTNLALSSTASNLCTATLQSLSPTQAIARLSTCPGKSFTPTQSVEIAELCFTATPGHPSAFVPIRVASTVVWTVAGLQLTNRTAPSGTIVVVSTNPLLELAKTSEQGRQLFLYANPGHFYQIDSSTNLADPAAWQLACRVPMTGPALALCCVDLSGPTKFFRAHQLGLGPTNEPPIVDAGPDQTVDSNLVELRGYATDDGLPAGCKPLTYQWSTLSGPGRATFSNPTSAVTAVSLPLRGNYVFRLSVSDSQAVNHDQVAIQFSEIGCPLSPTEGWLTHLSIPPQGAKSGNVAFTNCAIVLEEGSSFETAVEKMLRVPANPSTLEITFELPAFDTASVGLIGDAFEVALVDAGSRPLTYTIQGASGVTPASQATPATLPASPDACFNVTEGRDPFRASGTALHPDPSNLATETLAVEISHLPPGSMARLVLRLVNNDADDLSSVRVTDLRFTSPQMPLDLAGSPATALSTILGTSAERSAASNQVARDCLISPSFANRPGEMPKIVAGTVTTNALGVLRAPILAVSFPGDQSSLAPALALLQGYAIPLSIETGRIDCTNLIQNGGFETYALPESEWDHFFGLDFDIVPAGSTDLTSWSVFGETIDYIATYWPAGEGVRSLDLTGTPGDGGIRQAFVTVPGRTYQVSFLMSGNPVGGVMTQSMRVRVANVERHFIYDHTVNQNSLSDMQWVPRQFSFVATADLTELEFFSTPESGYVGPTLDGVRVMELGCAAAEQPNPIVAVQVNGRFVDRLDAAGNFFSPVEVRSGLNRFEVVATDARGLSTTNTITAYGNGCTQSLQNLHDISTAVHPDYGRTSFNDWTHVLYADVALRNSGSRPVRGPLYLGVTRISDPSVQLLAPDGVSTDGIPYYDFTGTLVDGKLSPTAPRQNENSPRPSLEILREGGFVRLKWPETLTTGSIEQASLSDGPLWTWQRLVTLDGAIHELVLPIVEPGRAFRMHLPPSATPSRTLAFHNPNHAQFTYELVTLGQLNLAPAFTTSPPLQAIDGRSYSYSFAANDSDDNALIFTLRSAPAGMVLDQQLRTLTFQPSSGQVGNHDVRLQVEDGQGGSAEQYYVLNVVSPPPNRPPTFVSTPVVLARVDKPGPPTGSATYTYDADAQDPDFDSVNYSLDAAPSGMNIDSTTGLIEWNPTGDQIGIYNVSVRVEDGRGGTAFQTFRVCVLPREGNRAPVIVSCPPATAQPGGAFTYQPVALDPDRDPLTFSLINGPPGMSIDGQSGLLTWSPPEVGLTPYFASDFTESIPAEFTGAGHLEPVQGYEGLGANGNTFSGSFLYNDSPDTGTTLTLTNLPPHDTIALRFLFAAIDSWDCNPIFGPDFFNVLIDGVPIFSHCFDNVGSAETAQRYFPPPGGLLAQDMNLGFSGWNDAAYDMGFDAAFHAIPHTSTNLTVVWHTSGVNWQAGADESWAIDNVNVELQLSTSTPIPVIIRVADGHGGFEDQRFEILVRAEGRATINGYVSLDLDGDGVGGTLSNLIANGDFSQGNTNFSSELDYSPADLFPDSVYSVDRNPGALHGAWIQMGDHTSGDGLMMIINGSGVPGLVVWEDTVPVRAGNTYDFSTWMASTYPEAPAKLRFSINDEPLGEPIQLTSDLGLWRRFFARWNSGTNETARIALQNDELAFSGNDFVIDDLQFGTLERPAADQFVFIDLNHDGTYNECEPLARTDVRGEFSFTNLVAGIYSVRMIPPPQWSVVSPTESAYLVSIHDNEIVKNVNFTVQSMGNNLADSGLSFISIPPAFVFASEGFIYRSVAQSVRGLALTYNLVKGPDGMAVDPLLGMVVWRPALLQVGTHDVVLRVHEESGRTALQSWQITVLPPNTAPFITTSPPGPAVVNLPWQYIVQAQDAEGHPIHFALAGAVPAGMTVSNISATIGALIWTPTSANAGIHPIEVVARDSEGAESRQDFDLRVETSSVNRPPRFTSAPRTHNRVTSTYAYLAGADDADGDPVKFTLLDAPNGAMLANHMVFTAASTAPSSIVVVWTPTASQLGSNYFRLKVEDGRGGSAEQNFVVQLVLPTGNSVPEILSQPSSKANIGHLYRYDPSALDPDQDFLSWRIVSGPIGLSIDPLSGAVRWIPTLDQLGTNSVTIEVGDALSATQQTWLVDVGCLNRPPQITSPPLTEAQPGTAYVYTARATDADGDQLNFSFADTNAFPIPLGMSLSNLTAGTGPGFGAAHIRWTPTPEQQGPTTIRIQVTDQHGETDQQTYTIEVGNRRANAAPVIVTTPSRGASIGRAYRYAMRATDADADLLTLASLGALPPGATFSPGTSGEAVLHWIPGEDQVGPQEFVLIARDPGGAVASQRFVVQVRSNQAPSITSTPRTNATPGVIYSYQVTARDPDGDGLTYSLADGPAGMSIDSSGRVTWASPPAMLGSYNVGVTAADSLGMSASQTFVLTVAADTQPPVVSLEIGYNLVDAQGNRYVRVGSTVTARVAASDNVGVTATGLWVDNAPVPLAGGAASILFPRAGLISAVATAEDGSGNIASVTNLVNVIDPDAANTVAVVVHSPTNFSEITGPVSIVGTITSQATPLVRYSVEVAEWDLNDADLESAVFDARLRYQTLTNATLPAGAFALTNAILARFDPTSLQNGSYLIRISAYDQNQNGAFEGILLNVFGNLKFGEFRVEFTDLQVPVAGIPISVRRVYDTRDARRSGDFGYGWSLGVQNARLLETGKSRFVGLGSETTFTAKTRVFLTTPDGRRVGFAFQLKVPDGVGPFGFPIGYSPVFGQFYQPSFQADPGVYDRLDPIDSLAAYQYNGLGQVVGFFGLYGYDSSGYRLTTKDNIIYDYDESFGLKTTTDPNGNRLEYTRDGIFHYSAGQTNSDQSIRFERDPAGRIIRVIDPAGHALNYGYDAAGDLRFFTDQVTNVTRYAYSAVRTHYLTNVIDPLGHNALNLEYDGAGRLTAVRDANGNTQKQDFDGETRRGTFTDGNGNVTELRFDERGNEIERSIAGVFTNRFEFDENNNLLRSINGRGYATNYTYDARGNVTSITDSLGHATQIAYNDANKPVSVTNALGQVIRLGYDEMGKLIEMVNNSGNRTAVSRDALGRVATLTDAAGNTTRFEYEAGCSCGRPGKVINPDGSFRLFEYNEFGQTNRVVDELGAETIFNHDRAGRLLSIRDALGHQTSFDYYAYLLLAIHDPLGRTTRYGFDEAGRTNQIIDAEGGIVRFEFDRNGNRTRPTDPVGNATTFVYDQANRLVQQVDPLGHTNFFAYDAAGNRIEAIDRNGLRRTFAYDAVNRMTNELWWEGTNVVRSIVFGFNELGVQTLAGDPAARYEYTYDAQNRLERVLAQSTGVPDFTLNYTYTPLGQVASVTDNWGVRVGSTYNNRNRLARRTWQGPGVDPARVDFTYDPTGNRTRTDRYADLAGTNRIGFTTNAYNRVGIVTNITHLGPASEVLAKYDYDFDAAYQITRWAINNELSEFSYDRTGQLTSATNTAQPNENFRYDANGNRIGPQSSGTYSVGPNNQLLSDGTNHYTYDFEGNMSSRSNTVTGVITTYQWNHRNLLVSVLDFSPAGVVTQTVAFVYDALNRRLTMIANAQTTRFLYDRYDSWIDLDAANVIAARYLHGAQIDELIARNRQIDGRGWYFADGIGSIREIANSAGEVIAHVGYSSFGQAPGIGSPAALDRFQFTGREWDRETGLYFYRARYYFPRVARFLRIDPIGFASGDYNPYRYTHNAPLSFSDPTGASEITQFAAMSGAFLGLARSLAGSEYPVDCPGVSASGDRIVGAVVGFEIGFVQGYIGGGLGFLGMAQGILGQIAFILAGANTVAWGYADSASFDSLSKDLCKKAADLKL